MLQEQRTLAPGTALCDRVAVILIGDRRLDRGAPARHVVPGQEAPVAPPGCVQDFVLSIKAVDRFGDEAFVPSPARRLDLGFAVAPRRLSGMDDPAVGLGN